MLQNLIQEKYLAKKEGNVLLKSILFEDMYLSIIQGRYVNFNENNDSYIGNYVDINNVKESWKTFERRVDVLDYIKDNVVDFGRSQAFKKAIEEVMENKLEKKDYDGIVNSINEAASIGSKDGGLRTLSDIEPREIVWLWENRIPLGKFSLLVGDPGTGKSYFSIFLSAQISKGRGWPQGRKAY